MPISSIVSIQITSTVQGITRAGFGVSLLGSANAAWVERVRSYADAAAVAVDFAVTTPEYLAALSLFSQNPKPPLLKIGRRALKPTQRWNIVPVAVASTAYRIRVGANIASFTSDASPLVSEITAGLTTAVNALSGDTLTASDLTTSLRLTGNTAGSWDDVEVLDTNLMSVEQDHADPGIATDLDAIVAQDDDWYVYHELYPSKATIQAAAAWIEAREKLMVYDSQETQIINVAEGSATDVFKTLKNSAYVRSAGIYHSSNGEFAAEAWTGRCLPLDPGSETWTHKQLAGVAGTLLTGTHETNIRAKNGNGIRPIAGLFLTFDGKVASGEYIDVVRFRDWFSARLRERIVLLKASAQKIPYDDGGIAAVLAEVRAQIADGIAVGGIASSPAPVVTGPKAADVPAADKATRTLKNVQFSFTLAGAIHATEVKGVVSV